MAIPPPLPSRASGSSAPAPAASPAFGPLDRPAIAGRIPALDGLRGFGLIMVIVQHFGGLQPLTATQWLYTRLVAPAWSALDIFFVLSGFLITGILWDTKASPNYFRNFYMRRLLRVFPIYYAALLLCAWGPRFLYPGGNALFIRHLGWYLTYGYNLAMAKIGVYSGLDEYTSHLWSMSVEEQFYLLWPVIVLLLSRRRFFAVCLAGFVGSIALRLLLFRLHASPISVFCFTLSHLEGLTLGSALAVAARYPDTFRFVRRLARPVFYVALLFLVALFAGCRDVELLNPLMQIAGLPLFAIFFSAGIAIMILPGPPGICRRFFSFRLFTFFGQFSYGAYVFHQIFRYPILKYSELLIQHIAPLRAVALHSVLLGLCLRTFCCFWFSFAIAFVVWHGYEKWFLRLKFLYSYKTKAVMPPAPQQPAA